MIYQIYLSSVLYTIYNAKNEDIRVYMHSLKDPMRQERELYDQLKGTTHIIPIYTITSNRFSTVSARTWKFNPELKEQWFKWHSS